MSGGLRLAAGDEGLGALLGVAALLDGQQAGRVARESGARLDHLPMAPKVCVEYLTSP